MHTFYLVGNVGNNKLSEKIPPASARTLQKKFTDEVIENAVAQWPQSIQDINGEEVISKLKSRCHELLRYAKKQYAYQAKMVDVRGTNKRDSFVWFRK